MLDKMPEKSMEDAMESASGPHFSGLRVDSLRNSSPTTPSSPSSAKAAHAYAYAYANATGTSVAVQTADDESMDASQQPFVIGDKP